jgi:superfamily II DNA or RNA helicase
VLVLFKTIKHGKIIRDLFEDQNIDVEFLSGKDTEKKRAAVKENLLSKKSMLAVCSVIYDVGIDVKTLNALVLCGAGRSTVKTLQRIGRVIRSNGPEKTSAAIIDFYDDIRYLKKHSLIRKAIYETEPEFVIRMPEIKKK